MFKIGFIGLGIMGKPMAKNLLKAGYELTVFDIIGNEIAVLVDEIKEKGLHAAEFKRENLSSGIYIIRFQANRYHASRKIVFLK